MIVPGAAITIEFYCGALAGDMRAGGTSIAGLRRTAGERMRYATAHSPRAWASSTLQDLATVLTLSMALQCMYTQARHSANVSPLLARSYFITCCSVFADAFTII